MASQRSNAQPIESANQSVVLGKRRGAAEAMDGRSIVHDMDGMVAF